MPREKVLSSPSYWFEKAQNELFRQFHNYMEQENINQTQLAERLGVSKGRISQILRGESNFTMKTLIELSLSINKIAKINYVSVDDEINADDLKRLERNKHRSDIVEKKANIQNTPVIKHYLPFSIRKEQMESLSNDSSQLPINSFVSVKEEFVYG